MQAGCPPPFPWRTRLTDEWMNKQSWLDETWDVGCLSWLGEWMATELFNDRWMNERRRTPALRTQRNGEIDLWWKKGRVQDEILWMTIVERQRRDERGREEDSTKLDGWMKESPKEASVLDERKTGIGVMMKVTTVQEEIIWMIIVERQKAGWEGVEGRMRRRTRRMIDGWKKEGGQRFRGEKR